MTEHTKVTPACQNRIMYSAKFPQVFNWISQTLKTIVLNYFNDNFEQLSHPDCKNINVQHSGAKLLNPLIMIYWHTHYVEHESVFMLII